jgi:predicted sulfurtransferase
VPNSSGQIITNENTKGMMQKQQPVSVNFSIQATDASGFDELLVSRKNQIVAMISQAMNQKGKVGLI